MLRRHSLEGFYDRSREAPAPVTGSGPGFQKALSKYRARLERMSQVGRWRHSVRTGWKNDNGTYIDRDWAIINY